jgi:hypothetical protein
MAMAAIKFLMLRSNRGSTLRLFFELAEHAFEGISLAIDLPIVRGLESIHPARRANGSDLMLLWRRFERPSSMGEAGRAEYPQQPRFWRRDWPRYGMMPQG